MSNGDWAQYKLSDRVSYVEKFGNVRFWYIFILLFYVRSTFLHEFPYNLSGLQLLLSDGNNRKVFFLNHSFRIDSFDMLVTFIFLEKFLRLKGGSFSRWRLICSKKRLKVEHQNVYIIKIINLNIFGPHYLSYLPTTITSISISWSPLEEIEDLFNYLPHRQSWKDRSSLFLVPCNYRIGSIK